jgi:hypothetical protein
MRVTVRRTRRAYVLPATHWASKHTDTNYPRMGERIRLRRDFDVTCFPPHVQAILKGLKKYGMLVADNGSDWYMSITPGSQAEGPRDAAPRERQRLRGRRDGRALGRGKLSYFRR